MEATAASIAFIQFAGQIVTTIVKAHKLWEEIKDLPAELTDLIDDLKAFEPLFRGIEAQVNSQNVYFTGPNGSSAVTSLECTRRAHKALEDMVKDMDKELSRKRGLKQKIAAAKIIIKKDMLEKLEKRLQRALRLLETSLQLYQSILLQNHPDVIARKVTLELKQHLDSRDNLQQRVMISGQTVAARMQPQRLSRMIEIEDTEEHPSEQKPTPKAPRPQGRATSKLLTKPPHSNLKRQPRFFGSSNFGRYAGSYTKDTGEWEAYIQLPRWISETIYEFQYAPSLSGWMFHARIYNIIPRNSEIYKRVKMGDEEGVIELFRTRQASPFDKDVNGRSLLYYATSAKCPDICQLLLENGLDELLDDTGPNKSLATPLTRLIDLTTRWQNMDDRTQRILQLFQSYLGGSESIPIERMFDMGGQYGYTNLQYFKSKYMMEYYKRSARDRLEATRLGCFVDYGSLEVFSFFKEERDITSSDIAMSTREGYSLMHSVAVGLARRLPDKVIPRRRPAAFSYNIFDEGWYHMIELLASRCGRQDLHKQEEVIPWDTDPVPVWRGTPLTSLVGGTLCFLSPNYQRYYWDFCFQEALQRWVVNLKKGGVDLVQYGAREQQLLRDHGTGIRGAFDIDGIKKSRTKIRKSLPTGAAFEEPIHRYNRDDDEPSLRNWAKDDTRWIPIRLIDLEYGPNPTDWRLLWAPELEIWAYEFWQLVEELEISLPGSWVE